MLRISNVSSHRKVQEGSQVVMRRNSCRKARTNCHRRKPLCSLPRCQEGSQVVMRRNSCRKARTNCHRRKPLCSLPRWQSHLAAKNHFLEEQESSQILLSTHRPAIEAARAITQIIRSDDVIRRSSESDLEPSNIRMWNPNGLDSIFEGSRRHTERRFDGTDDLYL